MMEVLHWFRFPEGSVAVIDTKFVPMLEQSRFKEIKLEERVTGLQLSVAVATSSRIREYSPLELRKYVGEEQESVGSVISLTVTVVSQIAVFPEVSFK